RRPVRSSRTTAVNAHHNNSLLEIQVLVRTLRFPVGMFFDQRIRYQEPVPALQQIDLHPILSESVRTGTYIRSFPHSPAFNNLLEGVAIKGAKLLRDRIKKIGSDDCLAPEVRRTVRLSEGIPRWIGVNKPVFGIHDVADRRTLFERLQDAVQVA